MEQGESAFLTNQGKNKDWAKKKGKGKVPAQADIKKEKEGTHSEGLRQVLGMACKER